MIIKTRIVANKAPPETPSKIARRFCFLCFLLVGIMTCGVSIVEDTLLHDNEKKERHGFPVVLINSKFGYARTHEQNIVANVETKGLYLSSRPVLLRDCGKGPTKLLFSRFLGRINRMILLCLNMVTSRNGE